MKNLLFVIWLLCWPLVMSVDSYVSFLCGQHTSDSLSGLVFVIFYAVIGNLLYEKI